MLNHITLSACFNKRIAQLYLSMPTKTQPLD